MRLQLDINENSNMLMEIEPRDIAERDTFAYCDAALSDDEILLLEKQAVSFFKGGVYSDGNKEEITSEIRDSDICWIEKNSETENFYKKISNMFAFVNAKFFGFELKGLYERFQYTTYGVGGHYSWHVDGMLPSLNSIPRKLSMSILLNDTSEFEGGELLIKTVTDEPVVIEQKKNRAVFFPSYTLHTVAPVTKGVRKSLVVWAHGPRFK